MTLARRESGFTFVEVLVALFLLAAGLLAIAPMFVHGARASAASGDMGEVGAEAVRRMEILRQTAFNTILAGGDLTASQTGFAETRPGVIVRWQVTSTGTPPTSKDITVRAVADRRVWGLEKEFRLSTRRTR